MRSILPLALALSACGGGSSPPAPPPVASAQWAFQFSPGTGPITGDLNSFSFNFPVGKSEAGAPSVHYVVRPPMSLGNSIRLSFSIVTSGVPVFQYKLAEDNTCAGEANVSLYVQRRGDDWSGKDAFGSYRWFSRDALPLREGSQSMVVPVDVYAWINVWGESNDAAGFAAAIADQQAIGLTFGGGCFKGHGVNIDKGSARFNMTVFK